MPFDCAMTEHPDEILGRDMFLCNRLADADIPIAFDHVLSWKTRDIASLPVSMAEAVATGPGE